MILKLDSSAQKLSLIVAKIQSGFELDARYLDCDIHGISSDGFLLYQCCTVGIRIDVNNITNAGSTDRDNRSNGFMKGRRGNLKSLRLKGSKELAKGGVMRS